jgi:copper transport protein
MKSSRQPRLPLLALGLLVALLLLPEGMARAHALLLRSLPEANAELAQTPARIELWFSEPLESGFSQAHLLPSSGEQMPTGAAMIDPFDPAHMTLPLGHLEPGVYTVAWQTLSKADGHEFYGSFPITVLNPDGSRPAGGAATADAGNRAELPSPAETAARWLGLLGGVLLFGAPIFLTAVLPTGRKPGSHSADAIDVAGRDLGAAALWIAAVMLILGHAWGVSLQAARLGGLAQLPKLLLETRSGVLALARSGLALSALLVILRLPQPAPIRGREQLARGGIAALLIFILAGLVSAAFQGQALLAVPAILFAAGGAGWALLSPDDERPGGERRVWGAALLLGGPLLFAISLGSHASSGAGSVWAVLGDFIHLCAAGSWAGGLLLLPGWLWRVRRSAEARLSAGPRTLLVVRRFSYLASFSIFVLTLSGVFNGLVEIPALADLWNTPYGRVLLVKLGLIALAMDLALLNNRLVHGGSPAAGKPESLTRLNRQVALESGLVLVLMLSVAVLVQTVTPRTLTPDASAFQPTPPYTSIVSGDDLYMHVQVSPNQVGDNRFWVHLYHDDGSPVGEVQLVQLRFEYRDLLLGQAKVDLQPLGKDTFAAEGAYLSQAGAWDVSAYIRRRDLDDTLVNFSLDVPVPTLKAASATPWQNPVAAIPGGMILIWIMAALGFVPVVWRTAFEELWPNTYRHIRNAFMLVMIPGVILGFVWLLRYEATASLGIGQENPVPASAASIAHGKAMYQKNCLPCHGPTGRGDGPAGQTLNPRPSNLQVHMVPGAHTDRQLFDWITDGFPNSPMPAFEDVLSEEERWHVLNYIRTLAP